VDQGSALHRLSGVDQLLGKTVVHCGQNPNACDMGGYLFDINQVILRVRSEWVPADLRSALCSAGTNTAG